MKTSEAIEFFKSHDVTDDQGYNILIEDLYTVSGITPETLANPVAQSLIQFYMYQIQSVLFPVIRGLRMNPAQIDELGFMRQEGDDLEFKPV